ncbi:MAG: ammonium transporter [Candidatus Bathyarchaeota archaeon]
MAVGDIAWISTATALVMLMTPALGFFYSGLVRKKNLVSTLVQCLIIFAVSSLVWTFWGYSLTFGNSIGGFIGDLSLAGLNNIGINSISVYAPNIPELLFFAFQLKFAAITPALIIGAFAERIKFSSLLIFTVLWSTFIYSPVAHWVWNANGWLDLLGAVDFAGGIVIHITAGFSALAAALVIGRRKELMDSNNNFCETEHRPCNIPYVILGASLLWFGWFGFNAGSALEANALSVSALVATNLAAAAAATSWMIVDWITKGKPSAIGISVGAVCGLVAVTPASGFVSVSSAIIIGLVAGIVSNLVANWRSAKTKIDDSLDVFACHGMSGVWGSIATGLFATVMVNDVNGFFYGNVDLLVAQILSVLVVAAYSFFGSYLLLKLINVFSPLRVSSEEEEQGLDITQHGEEAYDLGF